MLRRSWFQTRNLSSNDAKDVPGSPREFGYNTSVQTIVGQAGQSCSVEVRVRYAECDAMGYLHHSRYWEYFEHARTELLRSNGFRYRDLEAEGVFFAVYKCACKYILPIHYDDLVDVAVTVVRVTRTRVDHTYEIHRDKQRVCEASSTLACVGRDGRPILMPEAIWGATAAHSK